MADSSSDSKNRIIATQNFSIRGHLLKWSDTVIQISNIATVSTADLPLPRFPIPALVVAVVGVFLLIFGSQYGSWISYNSDSLTREQIVGILLLAAAIIWIWRWSNICADIQGKKYLNIIMNSGHIYSFYFERQSFMRQVLQVFANIFEDGATNETNFQINVYDCEIRENGAVVNLNST